MYMRSLETEQSDQRRQVWRRVGESGGGGVSLPLAPGSGPLLVVLDGDDEEDEQGDALDPRQQEEVVMQRAFVDVTKVFV